MNAHGDDRLRRLIRPIRAMPSARLVKPRKKPSAKTAQKVASPYFTADNFAFAYARA